jgi:hypothetical protein
MSVGTYPDAEMGVGYKYNNCDLYEPTHRTLLGAFHMDMM